MKRKRFIKRCVYTVLAVLIAFYVGSVVFNAFYKPIKTVSAVYIKTEDTIEVEGFVVREEVVLNSTANGIVEMQVSEGERAAKGDPVAYVYPNQAELDKVRAKKDLNERIARLETLMNQGNEIVDLKTVDTSIAKMSEDIAGYCDVSDYSRMPDAVDEIKNKTLAREYVYRDRSELKSVIDDLKSQRKAIGNATVTKAIYATVPGYYSNTSDGMEGVLSCSKVEELTPSRYNEIKDGISLSSQNDGTLGKIITKFYWNFAVVVSEKEAERITVGKSAKLSFDSPVYPDVSASVQWKSEPENGQVCVVFRIDEHIGDFTLPRTLKASIVIRTYEGLKVPREALRINEEGEQGVYCLIDSQAKFKKVETIFEKDSYYIVAYDSTNTKGLLLYDEIIVSAKELEHKKMVK